MFSHLNVHIYHNFVVMNNHIKINELKILELMVLPVCTLCPTCSSDIVTDSPFSRRTFPEAGKHPPSDGAGVVVVVVGAGVVVVVVVVGGGGGGLHVR